MLKIILPIVLLLVSSVSWGSEYNTPKQINCLAQNIYYEASGESYEGKVAVGQVTINRVMHPRFPKSVCGVVHQRTKIADGYVCQFEWFCKPIQPIKYPEEWQESLDIARRMLTDQLSYVSLQNVFFFHASHVYIPKRWTQQGYHRVVAKIGNHVFYRRRTL